MSLLIVILSNGLLLAQVRSPLLENPRYGATREDREECLKNTSYYQEYYKQNNYKDAVHGWSIVYTICPRSSENVYIRGLRMIKMSIDQTQDPSERKVLIDSMLRIYDKRITYFKKEGYNLTQKGIDLFTLSPERAPEVLDILRRAFALEGKKFDAQAMLVYMQATKDLYVDKRLSADSVISAYSQLSEVFAYQVEKNPSDDKVKSMSEQLDALFTSTGVASCDNLIAIYSPKLESNPTDVSLARSVYTQLTALRCTDAPIFLTAAETLFNSEPTASLGNEIARLYVARRTYAKADEYFKRAVSFETDSVRRAAMLVEYASFVGNNLGEVGRARTLAYEALSYNKNLGLAYFLIASLYANTKNCGSTKIDNASVYWAAVDKYQMAKSVDPSLEAECNKQIGYLVQFFPSSEDVFFQDLEPGKTFTVPCWINEKTTVRVRP